MNKVIPLFLSILVTVGCNNKETDKAGNEGSTSVAVKPWTPPPAGTVIDEIEEKISEDKLNDTYFRVTILSTETSTEGHYALKLEYGFNKNETTVDMPKIATGNTLRPVLKKGAKAFQCMLGFDTGDGKFNELYLISVTDGNIKMKQTTGYYAS